MLCIVAALCVPCVCAQQSTLIMVCMLVAYAFLLTSRCRQTLVSSAGPACMAVYLDHSELEIGWPFARPDPTVIRCLLPLVVTDAMPWSLSPPLSALSDVIVDKTFELTRLYSLANVSRFNSQILVTASGRSCLKISSNVCTITCAGASYVHYMISFQMCRHSCDKFMIWSQKNPPKWQKNDVVLGGPRPSSQLGWAVNWVDRLRTSADKRMWSGRRTVVMV